MGEIEINQGDQVIVIDSDVTIECGHCKFGYKGMCRLFNKRRRRTIKIHHYFRCNDCIKEFGEGDGNAFISVKIKRRTLKFLQELAHEMHTQDNRCTARPYYYVVQDVEWLTTAEGRSDDYEFYNVEENESYDLDAMEYHLQHDTFEDVAEELVEGYRTKLLALLQNGKYQELADTLRWELVPVQRVVVNKNIFLTERAIREHLQRNKHHYHAEARDYLCYAQDNPEMKALWDAILEIGQEDVR